MGNMDKRIEKGKETKENIVNATLKLFSEKGYDGTSIKDITDLAGIPKSLFYHYFKSKEELLEFILQLYSLRLSDEEKEFAQQISEGNPFEQIALRLFDKAMLDKDMMKIIMLEALKDDNILIQLLDKMNNLSGDFYSILPEQVKNIHSKFEINIFSFYFRIIPITYYIFTKDIFSRHYGISHEDLEKIFLKMISQNPYINKGFTESK